MKENSLLNSFINKLPLELHLPGYNYCGPGTQLSKRLARGDKGINQLDEYCKQHDIAYNKSSNLRDRHKADIILLKMAKKRASSDNANIGEKVAATLVNRAMLAKVSSGSGLKNNFKSIVSKTKKHIMKMKPKCRKIAVKMAIAAAKELSKNSTMQVPRIIPVPKTGGVLPLIPIFAGLSAAGSLAGGISGIVKTYNEYKAAKRRLAELKKHNEKMEGLSIGKGLLLKPYKNGLGIYLNKKKKL